MINVSYNVISLAPVAVSFDEDAARAAFETKIADMAPQLKEYYRSCVHGSHAHVPGFVGILLVFHVEIDDRIGDLIDEIHVGNETHYSLMSKLDKADLSNRDRELYWFCLNAAVGIADDQKTAIDAGKEPIALQDAINHYMADEIEAIFVNPYQGDFTQRIIQILREML